MFFVLTNRLHSGAYAPDLLWQKVVVWYGRDMAKIDFENPGGVSWGSEKHSGPIEAGNWVDLKEGVRYRPWKYENVNAEEVDGALVEIQPGSRTDVQYVETDHLFEEYPQEGKFLLIYLNQERGLEVYKYDASIEGVSFSLQAEKGDAMCIYALRENTPPGEVIECEEPGFSSANLVSIEVGTRRIGDLEIPVSLWQIITMLDEGIEDLPVDIIDLSEEF